MNLAVSRRPIPEPHPGGLHTASPSNRKLFLNLPVRDLPRSIAFFEKLGFGFDRRFADETSIGMVVGSDAYVMLLTQKRFGEFTRKTLCDTRTQTEGIFAVSVSSRAEVNALVETAIEAGGTHALEPLDMGAAMYGWSFYDLDGHHWEVFWMDEAAMPAGAQAG